MPRSDSSGERSRATGAWFTTTHWSIVWAARQSDSADSLEAREKLCRAYWAPLYAYIRRDGHGIEEAQDLTQQFFQRLLEKNQLAILQHQDGKFRCFLKTLAKNFLSDERDKARALKRGGGRTIISLDEFASEEGHHFEPADALTPEQVFERRWAQTLMERALKRLQDEYAAAGKAELFDVLKDLQPGEHGASSYVEVGKRFGLSESGMKTAVHRFRRRHQEILREEISHTVNSAQELEEEIRHLIETFGR
jgi:RNA polymerase sigma-70 factor (ECF subfamily)